MKTHEGAISKNLTSEQQLRRSVLSCMLWDNTFYEDGVSIAERIISLANEVSPSVVSSLAVEAREKYKLRTVPLLLANTLCKTGKGIVRQTLSKIIQRPDEIVKFLEIYWKDGKCPISKQAKKGLAEAFPKFNEYQLAKWSKDTRIKLRDVMFLTHPKPQSAEMSELWTKLANNELAVPDTWEVGLSKAKTPEEKKAVWEHLLNANKLGALALLRNFRNMESVSVNRNIIINAIKRMNVEKILPYRFITAAKYANAYSEYLEGAMFRCLEGRERIAGKTVLLVDVSGSMSAPLESKPRNRNQWCNESIENVTSRLDVANGLAILLRHLCDDVKIYSFSNTLVKISNRRGFSLGEEIKKSQPNSSTFLGRAVKRVCQQESSFDRLIIITDEQSHDNIQDNISCNGYIMNVAPYAHAIDHDEKWVRINGFSEAVIDWMLEYEKSLAASWLPDDMFVIKWEEK